MKNFSEHLKFIRKSRNLTQRQVARGIDIAERVYQKYEGTDTKPSFNVLIALADYFDVSLDYLVGRSDNQKRR